MEEVEEQKVRNFSLKYSGFPSDGYKYMSLTEWGNGEGYDLDIESPQGDEHMKLTNQDMNALFILYGKCNLVDD